MQQDRPVKASSLVFALFSEINSQRTLPGNIVDALTRAVELLNLANDSSDPIYDTSTVEGLKQLLAANESKQKKAQKSISIGLEQLDDMNENLVKYYESLDKIKGSVTQLEARITKYEYDLSVKEIEIRDLEQQIEQLKNPLSPSIIDDDDESPMPDPIPDWTPGQINFRNNRYVNYACNRIKYSQPVTANNFNNLVRIIIKNPDGCSKNSIAAWRQKVMDAYAWKTMAVGQHRRDYTDADFLLIMRAIRGFVKNNGAGAQDVPDHL